MEKYVEMFCSEMFCGFSCNFVLFEFQVTTGLLVCVLLCVMIMSTSPLCLYHQTDGISIGKLGGTIYTLWRAFRQSDERYGSEAVYHCGQIDEKKDA